MRVERQTKARRLRDRNYTIPVNLEMRKGESIDKWLDRCYAASLFSSVPMWPKEAR